MATPNQEEINAALHTFGYNPRYDYSNQSNWEQITQYYNRLKEPDSPGAPLTPEEQTQLRQYDVAYRVLSEARANAATNNRNTESKNYLAFAQEQPLRIAGATALGAAAVLAGNEIPDALGWSTKWTLLWDVAAFGLGFATVMRTTETGNFIKNHGLTFAAGVTGLVLGNMGADSFVATTNNIVGSADNWFQAHRPMIDLLGAVAGGGIGIALSKLTPTIPRASYGKIAIAAFGAVGLIYGASHANEWAQNIHMAGFFDRNHLKTLWTLTAAAAGGSAGALIGFVPVGLTTYVMNYPKRAIQNTLKFGAAVAALVAVVAGVSYVGKTKGWFDSRTLFEKGGEVITTGRKEIERIINTDTCTVPLNKSALPCDMTAKTIGGKAIPFFVSGDKNLENPPLFSLPDETAIKVEKTFEGKGSDWPKCTVTATFPKDMADALDKRIGVVPTKTSETFVSRSYSGFCSYQWLNKVLQAG